MTHVSQFFFAPSVERVLTDLHQLSEEDVPDLGETSAGGLHQGLQDGADVGLDAHLQQLLRLVENRRCEGGRNKGGEGRQTLTCGVTVSGHSILHTKKVAVCTELAKS